jgi:uncharacterized membrane protein
MNKSEYITRLAQGLKDYNIPNKYDILADYEQIVDEILIDYDNDFNAVIDKLGYPEVLADDVIQELGYGQSEKTTQQPKPKTKNYANNKRHKSNAVWNFILVFYTIIQAGLAIAFVVLVAIGLYFGFSGDIRIQSSESFNRTQTHIAVCNDRNRCEHYLITTSDRDSFFGRNRISVDRCIRGDCQILGSITHEVSFPLGFGLGISLFLIAVIMTLLYTLVYRTIKPITIKNNEYNRRRNYE